MTADKLARWHHQLAELNSELLPWVRRTPDFTKPFAVRKFIREKSPLDNRPDLRKRYNDLNREIADYFCFSATEEERGQIRMLYGQMDGIRSVMNVPPDEVTAQGEKALFVALTYCSILGLTTDPRDTILYLWSLRDAAANTGVDFKRAFAHVSTISEDEGKCEFASLKKLMAAIAE